MYAIRSYYGGILDAETIIAPTIESYLKPNNSNHLIDELEVLFNECILEFERKLENKN